MKASEFNIIRDLGKMRTALDILRNTPPHHLSGKRDKWVNLVQDLEELVLFQWNEATKLITDDDT